MPDVFFVIFSISRFSVITYFFSVYFDKRSKACNVRTIYHITENF